MKLKLTKYVRFGIDVYKEDLQNKDKFTPYGTKLLIQKRKVRVGFIIFEFNQTKVIKGI